MRFGEYIDFDHFCIKNNFSYREGIEYLDNALKKLRDKT